MKSKIVEKIVAEYKKEKRKEMEKTIDILAKELIFRLEGFSKEELQFVKNQPRQKYSFLFDNL